MVGIRFYMVGGVDVKVRKTLLQSFKGTNT